MMCHPAVSAHKEAAMHGQSEPGTNVDLRPVPAPYQQPSW